MKKNNLKLNKKFQKWGKNISDQLKSGTYPKYPNEIMLKTIFGGEKYFIKNEISKKNKILDIGCGFGNNLIPFIDKGCQTYGLDVDKNIIKSIQKIDKFKNTKFFIGHNRELPFKDNFFDLIISVNSIHYETNLDDILSALGEFKRVLKNNGILYLSTVGNKHIIKTKSKNIGNNVFKIKGFGPREKTKMFFLKMKEI